MDTSELEPLERCLSALRPQVKARFLSLIARPNLKDMRLACTDCCVLLGKPARNAVSLDGKWKFILRKCHGKAVILQSSNASAVLCIILIFMLQQRYDA